MRSPGSSTTASLASTEGSSSLRRLGRVSLASITIVVRVMSICLAIEFAAVSRRACLRLVHAPRNVPGQDRTLNPDRQAAARAPHGHGVRGVRLPPGADTCERTQRLPQP